MPAPLSPLKNARRDKLLDAAEQLFLSRGFRATTMESLAQAAGLSKVTVYGYFRDKDAAFDAVAQRLSDRLRAAVLTCLQADVPAIQAVTEALTVKHTMVHDLIRTSAFATEIMAQKAAVARIFASLDADLIAAIADLLGDAQTARLLFNAATGIADASTSRPEMQADIARLVAAILA